MLNVWKKSYLVPDYKLKLMYKGEGIVEVQS